MKDVIVYCCDKSIHFAALLQLNSASIWRLYWMFFLLINGSFLFVLIVEMIQKRHFRYLFFGCR